LRLSVSKTLHRMSRDPLTAAALEDGVQCPRKMHRERSDLSAQKPGPFASVSESEFSGMNPTDRAKYIEALITYVKSIRQDPPDEPFSLREQTPTLGGKDA